MTGHFVDRYVTARYHQNFLQELADRVDYMDVSPKQVVSVATALIPFLEHDDANRALMGANMQRQAVPLLVPRSPIVGTGIEWQAARDSGQVVLARQEGTVIVAEAARIVIMDDEGTEHEYVLQKFVRSNQDTCINQRPIVRSGDRVYQGQALAELFVDREWRAGAGPEHPRGLHELRGWQLRGRDPHLAAAGARRRVHLYPYREVRSRSPRDQAGP